MVINTFIKGIFREALARKIILTIFGIISFFILILILLITNEAVRFLLSALEQTSGGNMKDAVILFQSEIISKTPLLMLMCSYIVIVSAFIPSMLKKGYIDLILSKPISRFQIVTGHYIAGTVLIFFMNLLLFVIIWIVISAKTSVWHFPFLYSVFWFTSIFAVLYSIVVLMGFVTKNNILTIITSISFFFPVTWLLYWLNKYFEQDTQNIVFSSFAEFFIKFFYYLFPKVWDIQDISISVVKAEPLPDNYIVSISSTVLFTLVMLTLAIYYFNKKDY